jgi:hypothetical protein
MFTSYFAEYMWKRAYAGNVNHFKVFLERIVKVHNPYNPRALYYDTTQNTGEPVIDYVRLNDDGAEDDEVEDPRIVQDADEAEAAERSENNQTFIINIIDKLDFSFPMFLVFFVCQLNVLLFCIIKIQFLLFKQRKNIFS